MYFEMYQLQVSSPVPSRTHQEYSALSGVLGYNFYFFGSPVDGNILSSQQHNSLMAVTFIDYSDLILCCNCIMTNLARNNTGLSSPATPLGRCKFKI